MRVAVACSVLLLGCPADPTHRLTIDAVADFAVDQVEIDFDDGSAPLEVMDPGPWLPARRVGERVFDAPRDLRFVARALRDGVVVATQPVVTYVEGAVGVTVPFQSACRGVACGELACLEGECVDPRCLSDEPTPECPARCEDVGCTDPPADCAAAVCAEGRCFFETDDSVCETGRCDPTRGCSSGWENGPLLRPSSPSAGDLFGYAVAISGDGDTIAVGAPREDSAAVGVGGDPDLLGMPRSGAAYVFVRAADGWTQQAYLKASNNVPNGDTTHDELGTSLAISDDGDLLLVGAPHEDGGGAGVDPEDDDDLSDSGAAYLFRREGGEWSEIAYLKASNPGRNDGFGAAVAISGDGEWLAVGAPGEGSSTDPEVDDTRAAGAAYLYRVQDGVVTFSRILKGAPVEAAARFGSAAAFDARGFRLVVGAPGMSTRRAFSFRRDGVMWSPTDDLVLAVGGGRGLDVAVSLSGNGAAAAVGNAVDASSGQVHVFARSDDAWERGDIISGDAGDRVGSAVAWSERGLVIAYGAPGDATAAGGVDPPEDEDSPNAGAVRVFERGTLEDGFVGAGYLKAPEPGERDELGFALGMDDAGRTLVAGAPQEDGADDALFDTGAVYLFTRP